MKPKKVVAKKELVRHEKDPEYMVQVSEPSMLRKDLLESVREVIIFMQGYEKFRAIQEEKVKTFTALRADIKELVEMVDQLKRLVPKGNLKPIKEEETKAAAPAKVAAPERTAKVAVERPIPIVRNAPEPTPKNELDELEEQLQDIEGQLKGM